MERQQANMQVEGSDLERMRHVLGHRLINVASGIKAATGYLSTQLEERLTPREHEYFPLIQQQCDEVCTIVDRMNQLFGKTDVPERLPVQQALLAALEALRQSCPDAELQYDCSEEDCGQYICPLTVKTVLEEAVRNARQASVQPILIAADWAGAECVLRVIDRGDGFVGESAQRAFEMFFTTRARAMGLGLAIARKLVWEQGGRVALGQEDRGNYVEFALPLQRCSSNQVD